ncbi:energy-coupling factor ABC transporter ATP-binding protein [Rhodococcus pyridinivorans]|uniref:energy-coupling factor ABC transporter ATP-binding protein n=1 Tax=Rhodococcus pyridinivorans TaxID=103816 RepID=UPI000FF3DA10|nr:ABC transporter ATP-binding protein [Rhodococcus pyridinivorans]MCW3469602.1 energy-coupling factor ABC transporter ATP-binding protein [Rhodococcus pyridinivorans]
MSHLSLCAKGISYSYPSGTEPLAGATIDIPPASRVAILGANGSGKTTLLKILAGSLEPTSGTVEVDGVPLRHTRRGLRRHRQDVQLVLQDPDDQLFSADVAHDVAFGPANLGLNRSEISERVAEALDLLSIEPLADRPTHELSYGERKRVTIAGAMAMRPCVLLLDEPSAGLDPAGVEEMFQALDKLEKNHTTVVLSTHDTALAYEWADSVAVVHGGAVRQGPPDEILRDGNVMTAARLRPPWLIELWDRLHAREVELPRSVPRNTDECAQHIAELLQSRNTAWQLQFTPEGAGPVSSPVDPVLAHSFSSHSG